MRYVSTRGDAPDIGFRETALTGLAPDGGLYVPAFWPEFSAAEITSFKTMSFCEVAARVLVKFADGEIPESEIRSMAERAYGAFDVPEVAPLVPIGGDDYILELFHGPTLAFKDIAMRMLAQFYDWALAGAEGGKTIVGATSGDTGGAAIHAFAGSAKAEVFMLHPKGRISDVQRRMMTTSTAPNIVNIAVEGTFDDCQRIVKRLFADAELNARLDLGGVNSINWVRLAVQTVYYFTAAAQFDEPVSFVVPTGNFGDVFAGYAARKMGARIARLGVAVNTNDIMRRAIRTGVYAPSKTTPTTSPSMDIQVASNFERLLFEAGRRNAASLASLMRKFETDGSMILPEGIHANIAADFAADVAGEAEVSAMIRRMNDAGVLVDPHTAVGLVVLGKLRTTGEISGKAVCLSTAHPAKFPDAVRSACGVYPELPGKYSDIAEREERMETAPADAGVIREIVLKRSRFK